MDQMNQFDPISLQELWKVSEKTGRIIKSEVQKNHIFHYDQTLGDKIFKRGLCLESLVRLLEIKTPRDPFTNIEWEQEQIDAGKLFCTKFKIVKKKLTISQIKNLAAYNICSKFETLNYTINVTILTQLDKNQIYKWINEIRVICKLNKVTINFPSHNMSLKCISDVLDHNDGYTLICLMGLAWVDDSVNVMYPMLRTGIV